jgi:hypothetical protein
MLEKHWTLYGQVCDVVISALAHEYISDCTKLKKKLKLGQKGCESVTQVIIMIQPIFLF